MRRFLILVVLLPASWSAQGLAQPDQETFESFSWEGFSLSMTAAQLMGALEGQGYTATKISEQKNKIVGLYSRRTPEAVSKVQFIETNGALVKLMVSETRVGGAKNFLSEQAANEILERAKSGLDLEDGACRAGVNGGGTCVGQPASMTHTNSFNVSVSPRTVKITLMTRPLHESVVAANLQTASGLEAAYACFGTTDTSSVREVHDCLRASSRELEKLPPQGREQGHRPLQLDYPTLTCSNVADYYRRGLSFLDRDPSAIPSCKTLAAVIDRAAGKPPYWAACVDPRDDAAFFKNCAAGYTPSLVTANRLYLPSCEELQRSYKIGILAGQPDGGVHDVAVPDCDYVRTQAKSWRGELPATLKACEGYDPDHTAEHLMKCLHSERDFLHLTTCPGVRAAYERKVTQANGYKPEEFYPLPCDQAEPLLTKAEEVREKRRREAEELARRIAEARARAAQARKEYVQSIQQEMAQEYSDTAAAVASRTSPLEKQIRTAGGRAPSSCKSKGIDSFYCPPTAEEVRLAMMRHHARKTGFKIVNGHLLHGKQPTGMTLLFEMGGQPGKGMIGLELHYSEAELLYKCELRTNHYACRFRLPVKTNYDKLTQMYMDDLTSGSAFNINDFMFNLMDSAIAVEQYSFKFMLDNSGLWQSEPTIEQAIEDLRGEIQSLRN